MWQRHLFAGPKPLSKKDLAVAEYFATGVKKWQRHLAKTPRDAGLEGQSDTPVMTLNVET